MYDAQPVDRSPIDNLSDDLSLPTNFIAPGLISTVFINAIQAQIEMLTKTKINTNTWHINRTANHSFFITPCIKKTSITKTNLSLEALGIISTLNVLKSLSLDLAGIWTTHYRNLCHYSNQHPEISSFIA